MPSWQMHLQKSQQDSLQVPSRKMRMQVALRLQKRRLQMREARSDHRGQESLLRNVQEIDRTPVLSLSKNKREAQATTRLEFHLGLAVAVASRFSYPHACGTRKKSVFLGPNRQFINAG
jgi:hypothetical protein